MVEETTSCENPLLHSTSLNNTTSPVSVSSMPLMNHPLCQSLSFYSDNSTTPPSTQKVHSVPKPVESEQLQGELEFALNSVINDSVNSNIIDSSEHDINKSIPINYNLTYNSLNTPDGTKPITRYRVQINTGSPELSNSRRYRIQSCDIIESGSWIICDNIL